MQVYQILLSLKDEGINSCYYSEKYQVDQLPMNPKSGDVFLLKQSKLSSRWKQDGHIYLPRPNGQGFREDRQPLKIQGKFALLCFYSYIIKQENSQNQNQEITMNRRIYKLQDTEENKNQEKYILVHYLNGGIPIQKQQNKNQLLKQKQKKQESSSITIEEEEDSSKLSSLISQNSEFQQFDLLNSQSTTGTHNSNNQKKSSKKSKNKNQLSQFNNKNEQVSQNQNDNYQQLQKSTVNNDYYNMNYNQNAMNTQFLQETNNEQDLEVDFLNSPKNENNFNLNQDQNFLDLQFNDQQQNNQQYQQKQQSYCFLQNMTEPSQSIQSNNNNNEDLQKRIIELESKLKLLELEKQQQIQQQQSQNNLNNNQTNINNSTCSSFNSKNTGNSHISQNFSHDYSQETSFKKQDDSIVNINKQQNINNFNNNNNLNFQNNNYIQQNPNYNNNIINQNVNIVQKIKITEYSPEWDYIEGGTKMVLCFMPTLQLQNDLQNENISILFGEKQAEAAIIQPGVIKCFVPANNKGIVKLSVYFGQQRIDDIMDKPSFFEYRTKNKDNKKKTHKLSQGTQEEQDGDFYQSEFKVRVIEKLHSIQDFIEVNTQSNSNNLQQKQQQDIQKDTELREIIENISLNIQNLDSQNFQVIFKKLLKSAEHFLNPNQIKQFLEERNQKTGFSLIHLLSVLNFFGCFQILEEYGCQLNPRAQNGITPLQIAVALDYEEGLEYLLKKGVVNNDQMQNEMKNWNQNQKERNQVGNMLNVGQIYQNTNLLDMLVREATLHDSIHNTSHSLTDKFSWNEQDENKDENYIDLNDLMGTLDLAEELEKNDQNLEEVKIKNNNSNYKKSNICDKVEEDEDGENEEELHSNQQKIDNNLQKSQEQDIKQQKASVSDDQQEIQPAQEQQNMNDSQNKQQLMQQQQNCDQYQQTSTGNEEEEKDNNDQYNIYNKNSKHKYYRNYNVQNYSHNLNSNDDNKDNNNNNVKQVKNSLDKKLKKKSFNIEQQQQFTDADFQHIKCIQKNVRGWILRRQYLDIKYATRILQTYIKQKLQEKQIHHKQSKQIIKNKLKDWLNIQNQI